MIIESKSSISKSITANTDGHFDIKIVFPDETTIEKNNLGYITNADGSYTTFTITEGKELEFSQEY